MSVANKSYDVPGVTEDVAYEVQQKYPKAGWVFCSVNLGDEPFDTFAAAEKMLDLCVTGYPREAFRIVEITQTTTVAVKVLVQPRKIAGHSEPSMGALLRRGET